MKAGRKTKERKLYTMLSVDTCSFSSPLKKLDYRTKTETKHTLEEDG